MFRGGVTPPPQGSLFLQIVAILLVINLEAAVKRTPGNEKRKMSRNTHGSTIFGSKYVLIKNPVKFSKWRIPTTTSSLKLPLKFCEDFQGYLLVIDFQKKA